MKASNSVRSAKGKGRGPRRHFTVRQKDFPALRHFLETTEVDRVAPSMRRVIERDMPDLVHKLPPVEKNSEP